MYDAIVIGAGPAGSSAAMALAESGHRVLLVEKFKMPRNKSCSGVLIQKSIQLVRRYFGEDVPKSVMCSPVESKGMVFTNDEGREYRYEQDGLNIWRHSFDHWLVQKAVQAGAHFRDGTIALSCEDKTDSVVVEMQGKEHHSEQARFVIVCDGGAGMLRHKLTGQQRQQVITYQTFNKGSIDLDHHFFYAYLQPQFSEFDAWFNVKDGYLIFGVAVKDNGKIEQYYSQFLTYMQNRHNARITSQERAEKWVMPLVVPGCPVEYGAGRVLFAGEAAGFLNPMGEGISAGLETGYAAAMAVQQKDVRSVHEMYKELAGPAKVYMERQWRFVGGVSAKFADYQL